MTITPDQADQWAQTATPGPWYVHADWDDPDDPYGTFIYDDTGNMCITVDPTGSDYRKADLRLAAAAPELAQTIAGMREEWAVEMHHDVDDTWRQYTAWVATREGASQHLTADLGWARQYRLVRRLVGPVEVAE